MAVYASTRDISGTDTPALATDDGAHLRATADTVVTLTGTGWVAGRSAIAFTVAGASTSITFTEGAGVTIVAANSDETVDVRYQACVANYDSANTWVIHKGVDPADFDAAGSAASALSAAEATAAAALTAHEADTSVHGIADTSALETTTGSQAKVDAHTGDASAAHAASAIANTPTGNLAATDVQTALDELQGDIDGLVGGLTPQGTWNASTNTPTLVTSTGTEGHLYKVSVAGSTALDGISEWAVGDNLFFAQGVWNKVDNTDIVSSVAGKIGAVTLVEADITDLKTYHEAGGTDVPVTDGGTGASTAGGARTALGLAIGSDVQAYDAANALTTNNPSDFAPDAPVIISGTTHTLVAANHGKTLRCTNAGAVTVTIPTDASDDLVDGFWCEIYGEGAGGVSFSTTGITLTGSSPNTSIAQNESMVGQKTATANTWSVVGGTS